MSPRHGYLLYRRVEFNKAVPDIGQFLKLYDMGPFTSNRQDRDLQRGRKLLPSAIRE